MANLQAIGTVAARVMRARRDPVVRNVSRGLAKGAFAFGSKLGHVLHLLFLEVTGFLFIAVSLALVGPARHAYAAYAAGDHSPHAVTKVAAAGGFALMFFYFGVSSFFRAKRKAKKAVAAKK
jgi:hypothetical protein